MVAAIRELLSSGRVTREPGSICRVILPVGAYQVWREPDLKHEYGHRHM